MNHTSPRRRRILIALCAIAGASVLASAGGASAVHLNGASEKRCTLNEMAAGQTCTDSTAWRTN